MYVLDFLRSRGVWFEALAAPARVVVDQAGGERSRPGSQGCESRADQGGRFLCAGGLAVHLADRPGAVE